MRNNRMVEVELITRQVARMPLAALAKAVPSGTKVDAELLYMKVLSIYTPRRRKNAGAHKIKEGRTGR